MGGGRHILEVKLSDISGHISDIDYPSDVSSNPLLFQQTGVFCYCFDGQKYSVNYYFIVSRN
jgi:hypothetical protein